MNRGVLFVALLLLAVGVIGFQTGAYHEFERLFARSSTIIHPANSNGGSGTKNNNSNSTGNTNSNSNSTSNSNYFEVNTIINYGNSTSVWFNKTKVSDVWNFYNLTLYLTNGRVDAQYFGPPLNEHQILGLNGVEQTSTYYWSLWKFCPRHTAWAWSPVGADAIALSNSGSYGWYYQNYNTQFAPVAGANVTVIPDILSC